MRNYLLAAVAAAALTTPAMARDNSVYVGVDAGVMLVEDTTLDFNYDYDAELTFDIDDGVIVDHNGVKDVDNDQTLPLLMKHLTPARWELLKQLKAAGPLTILALAKQLQRDYKNVHTDVSRLIELELIARTESSLVRVAWDAVRAELRLGA